ncbi:MAG: hypothetical protein ACR2N5_02010, partial [Solirubrobacterales bacterium]
MGYFDDAIREHLELKRRGGAAADEVEALEHGAFGEEPPPDTPETADEPLEDPAAAAEKPAAEAVADVKEGPPPDVEDLTPPPEPRTEPPEASTEAAATAERALDEPAPAEPRFDLSERSFEIPDPVPDVTFPGEEGYRH